MIVIGVIIIFGLAYLVWQNYQILKNQSFMATSIQAFAAAQNEFNDKIDKAITGLEGDIATLNATIEKLQSTPGTITPEDQALLDQLQARGKTIADKLDALDALTPPTPPTA